MSTLAEQVITVYDAGDTVPLEATFRNAAGTLVNPSGGVVIQYRKPRSAAVVTPTVANPSTGLYAASVVPADTEYGDWWWIAKSSGDLVQAGERTFHVRAPRTAVGYGLNGLNTDAIVTLGEARIFCLRDETDGSRDALLAPIINAVSKTIARICDRQFVTEAAAVKTFSYNGLGHLSLAPFEIRTATLVEFQYLASGWTPTYQTLTVDDYRLNPRPSTPEGTYLYMTLPETWNIGNNPTMGQRGLQSEVRITGDWGMTTIPDDVKLAALIAVDARYKNPSGVQNVNVGDLFQQGYPPQGGYVPGIPAEALSLLDGFRRSGLGV